MILLFEVDAHGRPIVPLRKARELADNNVCGTWYTAPFATKWTVGIAVPGKGCLHILDEQGEPLRFETESDAWEYLRSDLKLPSAKLPPFFATQPSSRRQVGALTDAALDS